jgi:hypothetical protein
MVVYRDHTSERKIVDYSLIIGEKNIENVKITGNFMKILDGVRRF